MIFFLSDLYSYFRNFYFGLLEDPDKRFIKGYLIIRQHRVVIIITLAHEKRDYGCDICDVYPNSQTSSVQQKCFLRTSKCHLLNSLLISVYMIKSSEMGIFRTV